MKDQFIIKREDGKTITVNAVQAEEGIIITKEGDKTEEPYKRKVILESMDLGVYKKFVETEIHVSEYSKIMGYIKHLIK